MRTVAKITTELRTYLVVRTDSQINPYSLYSTYYDRGMHRHLISKYADLRSCLLRILEEGER